MGAFLLPILLLGGVERFFVDLLGMLGLFLTLSGRSLRLS
jgi:hypothetical protein